MSDIVPADDEDTCTADICDCGHPRRRHNNGLFECRRCGCKEFHTSPIPDLFEDLSDADVDTDSE